MSNDNPPALNGYVCFFRNRRTEVYASTSYEAQTKAAAVFKARKQYEVTVVLAEKGGAPVVHSTASL
jgi:ABC-type thiamine transport system substrate-binding protein